jgi:hypothetical protein
MAVFGLISLGLRALPDLSDAILGVAGSVVAGAGSLQAWLVSPISNNLFVVLGVTHFLDLTLVLVGLVSGVGDFGVALSPLGPMAEHRSLSCSALSSHLFSFSCLSFNKSPCIYLTDLLLVFTKNPSEKFGVEAGHVLWSSVLAQPRSFPGAGTCWSPTHVVHHLSWCRLLSRLHSCRGGSCIAREPRGAVRVRRRPLAVSSSCWWQPERRLVGDKLSSVSGGDLEAASLLEATPVQKTDAWIALQRWVVYVSLLDLIVIFIFCCVASVFLDFYVQLLYCDLL